MHCVMGNGLCSLATNAMKTDVLRCFFIDLSWLDMFDLEAKQVVYK
jgi:hypothetical protein